MKRVLVVQNHPGSGLGQLEAALAESNVVIDLRVPYEGEALPPDTRGHDGAILLGGAQNALADDTHPYFPHLLRLARGFSEEGKAVLGICLGAQLLARAFGGQNRVGGASEFGWCEVMQRGDAEPDPFFAGMPDAFRTFQWHDDTFSLPPDAIHLASSPIAASQAFRIGRATYGTQFHFEADTALVAQWTTEYADWLAVRQPDWSSRFATEAALHGTDADALGARLARNWVKLV